MRLVLLALFLILQTSSAMAAELTEQSIRDIYKQSADLATGKTVDAEKNMAFLKKHLTEDVILNITMNVNVLEEPIVTHINKEEAIKTTGESYRKIRDSESRVEISSIDIAESRQEATVKHKVFQDGVIHEEAQNGNKVKLSYQSISTCTDLLIVNKEIIQWPKSSCNTNVIYGTPEIVKIDHDL
ncbi:MAG: hypothetical protein DHS20C02_05890 [Micavibrio sp.]|nr:MAG: hypothetical protein DHS20C02_05890 [Micavibrio sp.]